LQVAALGGGETGARNSGQRCPGGMGGPAINPVQVYRT
jgi:hypothetical protein